MVKSPVSKECLEILACVAENASRQHERMENVPTNERAKAGTAQVVVSFNSCVKMMLRCCNAYLNAWP